uniref:Anti-silencing function protein 1 n=1 Tax=Acrobeloides nanus TaxID=290746 RepID=A0A914EA07_9BILA
MVPIQIFYQKVHNLEWELIYVGSSETPDKDQLLDSVVVGPINEGRHKFIFEADPPNPDLIPTENVVDVTVILLRCSYNGQKFTDIGWFVSNEYQDEELVENPPTKPVLEKIRRTIKTDDVRVTMFTIKWDDKQDDEIESTNAEAAEVIDNVNDSVKVMDIAAEDTILSEPFNDKTNC